MFPCNLIVICYILHSYLITSQIPAKKYYNWIIGEFIIHNRGFSTFVMAVKILLKRQQRAIIREFYKYKTAYVKEKVTKRNI